MALRNVWWETTMFSSADNVDETRKDLQFLLECLAYRNQDYLKMRPDTPRLYKSGVIWEAPKQFDGVCEEVSILRKALGKTAKQRDVAKVLEKVQGVFGGEHFCDIGVILELGAIDCDGIASYRAAELRQAGIPARPFMTSRERPGGGTTYHALVIWPPFGNVPYETDEDPSLLLGMGGASRAADRQEEIRKNIERGEIIAKYGIRPVAVPGGADFEAALAEVLGLRTPQRQVAPRDALAELDKILRRAA